VNEPAKDPEPLGVSAVERIDEACDRFEKDWQKAGAGAPRPCLEDYVGPATGAEREALLRELIALDVECRVKVGEHPAPEEYRRRLPGNTALIQAVFATVVLTTPQDNGTPPPADSSAAGRTPTAPDGAAVEEIPEWAGRYCVEGEIGRGGMGVILRARDPELNRPLAVKVLLKRHVGKPEMERRFLEEAQVTGQLQHPGVPPVHDQGRLDDGRPFFAMKLVKSRTLADLLKECANPAAELPRWLAIFEQVCQTLAYAHSKGVIHRDLKPNNVMVGAFGEVQVMDWGLAKVLPQGGEKAEDSKHPPAELASVIRTARNDGTDPGGSETRSGSMMGTPSYMAPEQARGELELVDRRADVFGLGGILCQLLTGQPPFTGSPAEVEHKAQHADLAEAFARLDACGADAELAELAKRCLAARPWNRPRDAGEVAEAVKVYQGSVVERLRRAELERAQAEVKAVEERKRRRQAMVLGGVILVLLAILAIGGISVVYRKAESARSEAKETKVELAKAERAAVVAYSDLGTTLAQRKELNEAVAAYRKAIALKPDYAAAYNNLATVLAEQGNLAEAEFACRKAVALAPEDAAPYTNLGNALGAQHKLAEAEAAYRKAIELKPDSPEAHAGLGDTLAMQRRLAEAERVHRRATELSRRLYGTDHLDSIRSLVQLGAVLQQRGKYTEALLCYRQALQKSQRVLGPKNQLSQSVSKRIGQCEQLQSDKLNAVMKGEVVPKDGPEWLMLAALAQQPRTRLYWAAARFYTEAFKAAPGLADDRRASNRYNAACAAVLAAAGKGEDTDKLGAAERVQLRQHALEWLKADLAAWAKLAAGTAAQRQAVRQGLSHWRADPALAGVRDKAALEKLPAAERDAWRKFWADVDDLRKRIGDKK
jgi:tetratricopeptide (TPR) repeat protein